MKQLKEVNFAITICDKEGKILEMNDKSMKTFAKSRGADLIGKQLQNCHPEPAKTMLEGMLANPITNVYTIEKAGVKKLIYQTAWYEDGEYMGLVELSLEIPFEMKHKVRQG